VKIPRQISLKKAATIILISVLLTAIGSYYAFAATPTSTFTISPGIYPGAPSYTIWKEGNSYFAKNSNGKIEFSGTNASYVLIKAKENGDFIFIKAGVYEVNNQIAWDNNTVVMGEGTATVIRPTTTSLIDGIFRINNAHNVTIANLMIDGDSVNRGVNEVLIDIRGSSQNILVQNVFLKRANQGIRITGSSSKVKIVSNTIYQCYYGILACVGNPYVDQVIVANNHVYGTTNHYVSISFDRQIRNSMILNNIVEYPSHLGIAVASSENITIANNEIVMKDGGVSGDAGVHVEGHATYGYSYNIKIENNRIIKGRFYGIEAFLTFNLTISNNEVYQAPKIGIMIGSCQSVIIAGNTVDSSGSNGIQVYNSTVSIASKFILISNNISKNNDIGQTGGSGIRIGEGTSYISLIGNACYDDRPPGSRTQNYGISIAVTDAHIMVVGNLLTPNTDGGLDFTNGTSDIVASNMVS